MVDRDDIFVIVVTVKLTVIVIIVVIVVGYCRRCHRRRRRRIKTELDYMMRTLKRECKEGVGQGT